MSVEQVLYILIACNAGLLGMFVWHLFKCRDTRIDMAVIKNTLDRMEKAENREVQALWDQVGRDSDHGMRKVVHAVGYLPSKFVELDRDLEELRKRVDQR